MAVVFDLETYLIRGHEQAPKPVCLSYADDHEAGLIPASDIETFMVRLLTSRETIVGHNVAFDFAVLLEHFPALVTLIFQAYEDGRVSDTMIRERLLDIELGKFPSLAAKPLGDIVRERFKVDLDKDEDGWRTRYAELDGIPVDQWPQRAIDYSVDDSRYTHKLWLDQRDRGARRGYPMPTEALEVRAAFCLRLMGAWGIRVDQERAGEFWDRLGAEMEGLRRAIYDAGYLKLKRKRDASLIPDVGGIPLDVEMSKNMKKVAERIEAIWDEARLGEMPLTPGGKPSTKAEVLEASGDPDLVPIATYAALEKTRNTFVRHLVEGDDIIHARFFVLGAESSRTSCRAPNLQNQPRMPGVRECFIPRRGCALIASDFDAQEMRTLAQAQFDLFGRSTLGAYFQRDPDFDPHSHFAAQLLGRPYGEVLRLKKTDKHVEDTRSRAKVANFGYAGGMGARTFMDYALGYGIELSLDEAEHLKAAWRETWTEMTEFFNYVSSVTGDYGSQQLHIVRSGFKRGRITYTNCANGQFQSLAAHATKEALWRITRRCYDPSMRSVLFDTRPVNVIHDETLVEVPEYGVHECSEVIREQMEAGQGKWTPDVPPRAGVTAMAYWSKEAKELRDDAGRLEVWRG